MNDSFLYHMFGIRDMHYKGTKYKGRTSIITLEPKYKLHVCPKYGGTHLVRNGYRYRDFHGLPIGGKNVVFHVKLQRYTCRNKECDFDRQQDISFADGGKGYIKRLATYVVDMLKIGTIKDVANHLGMSWDTVKEIHKTYLTRHYSNPSIKGVTRISIDEFAVRKGHLYKTIVVDLDSGRILYVGDGKGSDALDMFWKRVKRNRLKIEIVTMDMSAAFFSSVSKNAPDAVVVFDHFHVVKLMNEAVDKVRRDAYREECKKDKEAAKAIKGTKWILMANLEDISDKEKLDKALNLNDSLFKAYYLKEDLRQIWCQVNKTEAEKKLLEWVNMARETGISHLIKTSNTIMAYRTGILGWYDLRVSNAMVEGINNKIKVLKRVAYGYRDDEYLKLRLFALHDAKITRNVG